MWAHTKELEDAGEPLRVPAIRQPTASAGSTRRTGCAGKAMHHMDIAVDLYRYQRVC